MTGVRDIVNQNRNDWLNFRSVLTDARIMKLDNLDAKISTRAPANTALSNAVWTDARAGYLNNLDAKISTRAAANTALSTATWTNARAGYLDKINTNLDAKLSTVNTNVTNALNKAEAARVAAVDAGTKATAVNTSLASGVIGPIIKTYINKTETIENLTTSATLYTITGKGKLVNGTIRNSNGTGNFKIITVIDGISFVVNSAFGSGETSNAILGEAIYFSKSLVVKLEPVTSNIRGTITHTRIVQLY